MNIGQLITKAFLSLPQSMQNKMSGGEPPTIDGRTLDARCHFISAQGAKAKSFAELTPDQARAAARQGFKMLNPSKRARGVKVWDETLPASDGTPLPIRHYHPKKAKGKVAGILYLHMGGWVIGDLDTNDYFCSLLSARVGAHVISLDYRLAPEHKFPVAMEDGFDAYLWMRANADRLNINLDHIAVGGDSAGGCMTAVLCQEMKRRGKPQPQVQMLIYPATDFTDETGSMQSCSNCQPLTRETMEWFGAQWLHGENQRPDPVASPMKGDITDDLASALVVTAGFDPLRDQGKTYADRLAAAGVDVRYSCADTLCHAFTSYAGVVPAAMVENEKIAANLKEMLRV